jgi:hypothetical protein
LQELETQSAGTDSRSETAALAEATLSMVTGQRQSQDQLDRLAAELREQLDQEYTSLITSIEEVQALMEAEVSSAWIPPSTADLEAFTKEVDKALVVQQQQRPDDSTCTQVADVIDSRCTQNDTIAELDVAQKPLSGVARRAEAPFAEQYPAGFGERSASIPEETSLPQSGPAVAAQRRPRWADMASDSEDDEDSKKLKRTEKEVQQEHTAAGRDKITKKATATCSKCNRSLGKDAFSRRAWRQARGLGGSAHQSLPEAASASSFSSICLQCTGGSKGTPP